MKATTIQLRRGTSAEWGSADPILAAGEPAYSIDTNDLRIGDGSSHWSDLPGSTMAPVRSVSGQTGDVLTSYAVILPLGDVAAGDIDMDLAAPVDIWTARLTGDAVSVAVTRPQSGTRIGSINITRDSTTRTAALTVESGVTVYWAGGAAVSLAPQAGEVLTLTVRATAGDAIVLAHVSRFRAP